MTYSKISRKYERILMRADGSSSIGMGHVVRSLVLARELLDLGAEVEVWGTAVAAGKALAESFGPIPIRDQAMPDGSARELPAIKDFMPDLVIADGYHFRGEFFSGLESLGIQYGVIDDNTETRAGNPLFVLNQNPSASAGNYRLRYPASYIFAGLEYSLIRREIKLEATIQVPERGRTLVNLGGSDLLGLTPELVEIVGTHAQELLVIVGPQANLSRYHLAKIKKVASLVDPSGFATALTEADLCILAAGTSLWEANALGKRTIALVVADNQITPALKAKELGTVSGVFDFRGLKTLANQKAKLRQAINEAVHGPAPRVMVNASGALLVASWLMEVGALDDEGHA